MNFLRPGRAWWSGCSTMPAAAIAIVALTSGPHTPAQEFPANAGWRDVSLAEYRQHLENLDALVAACQQQRTAPAAAQTKGASKLDFPACDPAQIGPDDRVQWTAAAGSQPRQVRYDWLRTILSRAAKKAAPQTNIFSAMPGAKAKPLTADALLSEARQRLQDDSQQIDSQPAPNSDHASERKSLNAILAQRAYQNATRVTMRERFLEWFSNELDKFFASLVRIGARAPWIGLLLRVLLIAGACTALVWLVLRIEKQSRVRLIPEVDASPGGPSARDWQLWLRDAQAMAAQGRWRDAIHFLYWAAISRLESKRLWPADRARTPREYLGLLAGTDPRKPNLAALTRSFERTWYGGRDAAADDFNSAMDLARALGVANE